jgi:hypothetical protein
MIGDKRFNTNSIDMLNLAMLIWSKYIKLKEEYDKLKNLAGKINNLEVLYSNITNNTLIKGDSMFSTRMYLSGNNTQLEEEAVRNNFPIFNLSDCEPALKVHYNLTDSEKIIYLTNNMNSLSASNNNTITEYTISAYNPITKEKLSLDICKDLRQTIQLPISNSTNFNMTLYKELKTQGIDIFDRNNTYFNDRCASYIDPSLKKDTTINWRREKLLQSTLPQCEGFDCTYIGINDNGYVECSCGIKDGIEFINKQINYAIDVLTRFNVGIFICVNSISVSFI